MKLSLVLIIYRSDSSIALQASKFSEEVLKDKILERLKQEHDSKIFSHQHLILLSMSLIRANLTA